MIATTIHTAHQYIYLAPSPKSYCKWQARSKTSLNMTENHEQHSFPTVDVLDYYYSRSKVVYMFLFSSAHTKPSTRIH